MSIRDRAKALSDTAVRKNKDAKLQIKLETGMSRIGFLCDESHALETIDVVKRIANLPNIEIDGIFTHLSCADEDEYAYTKMQFDRFMRICDKLQESGVDVYKRQA